MHGIVDFLTIFTLAGATVLFTMWIVLANSERIACAADALAKMSRPRIVVFLAFAAIATVCAAFILPSDYADYISSGNGLPMLTLDFQEKTLVHDVISFPSSAGNISAKYPVDPLRVVHAEPIVVGDSGNPRFLLIDATPILVSTLWMGPDSPATGPFLTVWKDEIQNLVDELSYNAGLDTNMYRLVEFDLSQYQKLSEGRR